MAEYRINLSLMKGGKGKRENDEEGWRNFKVTWRIIEESEQKKSIFKKNCVHQDRRFVGNKTLAALYVLLAREEENSYGCYINQKK